ncbi:MAG TPA: DUF4255 domain-containing protein [Thermomicrobiales bacterium]|nr:DUF4255 domain-containing protein [Thermomicrobiales bacterium]
MSNALAVAAVTAVLKDLLDNGLIDRNISAALGGPVTVSALPPDRVKGNGAEPTQLNLFLYHVAPNPGWRNVDLPARDGRGERTANPPLALDLFYLLTAFGRQDFEAEILLGYAMHLLHETPVLTRDAVRRSLAPVSPVTGGLLPPPLDALAAAELADQVEQIKVTPQPLNTEEISKLWTALQTNYRPSVAYQASVVLIEGTRPARAPLPVLTRGPADRGVVVAPAATPPPPTLPTLTAAVPPNRQPAARPGDTLALTGFALAGDSVTVRFSNPRLAAPLALPALPGGGATGFTVRIPAAPDDPQAPADWVAGIVTLTAVIGRAGQPDQTTNDLALPLAPAITGITPDPAARDANGRVTLTVACQPRVRPAQRVSLFLGDREAPAEPRATPTGAPTFRVDDAPPGEHWVRLRVDGVDSLLVDRAATPPVFDPSQRVRIT